MSSDSALLCVEYDQVLLELSRKEISPEILGDPRFCLIGTGDPMALCGFVRSRWGARAFRRVEVLRTGGGWQLFPQIYGNLTDSLKRSIAVDWGNAITMVKLGRRYARNMVRNLSVIPGSGTAAELDFGDAPTLVLGAGPSLDTMFRALEAEFSGAASPAVRSFRILCVDTALGALLERGIIADAVIALEAQQWNLRDFIGAAGEKIPLAMDLSALPATAGILKGGTYLFFTPWTVLRFFDRLRAAGILPPELPPLGSVGLSAAALAAKITRGPVVTAGLDFSFTLDAYHAKSTPGSLDRLRSQTRLAGLINPGPVFRKGVFTAAAKDGTAVLSDPALRSYRDLFEEEFSRENRMTDTVSGGLPLGIPAVGWDEAWKILTRGTQISAALPRTETPTAGASRGAVADFIRQELDMLRELRDILSGKAGSVPEKLGGLLDACDYLWAHFPESAGAEGKRPESTDISFLKRVRAEIDPFITLFERSLKTVS
ncbi:6-hydroxymethylpterin diphosphokinase MptE-like protein [Breznakiella homolactica]|nr:6-hydroxymethylpterin diphosphokinase MptE-like protein [Breznakiella homolactica]